jgi:hypothetical protein
MGFFKPKGGPKPGLGLNKEPQRESKTESRKEPQKEYQKEHPQVTSKEPSREPPRGTQKEHSKEKSVSSFDAPSSSLDNVRDSTCSSSGLSSADTKVNVPPSGNSSSNTKAHEPPAPPPGTTVTTTTITTTSRFEIGIGTRLLTTSSYVHREQRRFNHNKITPLQTIQGSTTGRVDCQAAE